MMANMKWIHQTVDTIIDDIHICYGCGQPTPVRGELCETCLQEIEPEPDAPAGVSRSHNMIELNERI